MSTGYDVVVRDLVPGWGAYAQGRTSATLEIKQRHPDFTMLSVLPAAGRALDGRTAWQLRIFLARLLAEATGDNLILSTWPTERLYASEPAPDAFAFVGMPRVLEVKDLQLSPAVFGKAPAAGAAAQAQMTKAFGYDLRDDDTLANLRSDPDSNDWKRRHVWLRVTPETRWVSHLQKGMTYQSAAWV